MKATKLHVIDAVKYLERLGAAARDGEPFALWLVDSLGGPEQSIAFTLREWPGGEVANNGQE